MSQFDTYSTPPHRPRTDTPNPVSFIECDTSRGPLNCTPEMFEAILDHHIMPYPLLHPLVDANPALGIPSIHFRPLIPLIPAPPLPASPICALSHHHSNHELRYTLLLRGVEPAPNHTGQAWFGRPAAIYHSYDFSTGRAVWVVIKANGVLRERIQEVAVEVPWRPEQRRKLSCETVMAVLTWCEEGWGGVVRAIEGQVQAAVGYAQRVDGLDRKEGKSRDGGGEFRYKELQRMSRLADQIGEMELVLSLAERVVGDLAELYNNKMKVPSVVGRMKEIARRLETRRAQIAAKGRRLENGRRLVSDAGIAAERGSGFCV